MFHKILVAIDGSDHADAALQLAADLARHHNAELGILHAYQHVTDVLGTPNFDHLLATRIRAGEELLEAAQHHVPNGIFATTQLLEGPAAPAILRVAQTEDYDLIVLGSRGRGQVRGLLLGSVSTVVAQRATCHVLIAHSHPQVQPADASSRMHEQLQL